MFQTFIPPLPRDGTAEYRDVIILGAGVSGLVAASVLGENGHLDVLVVDEYNHIGGNHIDWSANGYTFDIGSLIFQDDSPLLRHFPELLQSYVPINPRWGRLNPQGMITDYPLSVRDDILKSGPVGMLRILGSVVFARLFQRRMKNARDFARYWIGARFLWSSGLETYMSRFYGVEPAEIDIDLARKRMLWISEHASLANIARRVFRRRSHAQPTNQQLARPKEGFAVLYSHARERLERAGATFQLGAELQKIEKEEGKFVLHLNDRRIIAPRLISTIPIPRLAALCGLSLPRKLETSTLIALYFSFSGSRGFSPAIIYNFSHGGAWKRLTVYSDFYGLVRGREYFAAEVMADHVGGSIEKAERDFREHMRANGLFDGDLILEGAQTLTNAYPIYRKGAAQAAAEAIDRFKALGIESAGRQGTFNYQPTARVSTIEVEEILGSSVIDRKNYG